MVEPKISSVPAPEKAIAPLTTAPDWSTTVPPLMAVLLAMPPEDTTWAPGGVCIASARVHVEHRKPSTSVPTAARSKEASHLPIGSHMRCAASGAEELRPVGWSVSEP